MITAMRAPTSQAGTTAGTTIFRSVVSGPKLQHPRDVVLARMNRGHTRGGVQHDRPQRGVCGEDDLGRGMGPKRQHRDRHQRDGGDGAQEVDARHPISPHQRYESDGESQCCAEGHRHCRGQRRDAEGVRDIAGEFTARVRVQRARASTSRGDGRYS